MNKQLYIESMHNNQHICLQWKPFRMKDTNALCVCNLFLMMKL